MAEPGRVVGWLGWRSTKRPFTPWCQVWFVAASRSPIDRSSRHGTCGSPSGQIPRPTCAVCGLCEGHAFVRA
eukprot:116260-Prymnesium_polylepis.1